MIGDRHSIRLYLLIRRKLVILCSSPNRARWRRGELLHHRERVNWHGDACQKPIFDDDGKVIGVVSIGYLVIKSIAGGLSFYYRWQACLSCVRDFDVAIVVPGRAYPSADEGMEPKQIARVVRQQEALFSWFMKG